IAPLIINEHVRSVLLREALKEIILVLVDPPDKVAGNADAECPIASAGLYVDRVWHKRRLSGFRPSPE
ncbi:MAG: hypothetical protein Q7R39_11870, partial [Dehalococcoidia bacterium]|nr:hypothetical protein [Dehalococcoidia bacterium]